MSDIADRAAALEEKLIEEARYQHELKNHQKAHHQSLEHCVDCGENIPLARQRAIQACTLCVKCQEEFEKLEKKYGR